MAECSVCFRKCNIAPGATGWCGARGNIDGKIKPLNYGLVTGLALDPIEKKPLKRFYPGSNILSVGSYGCNLDCPFCQNFEIARGFAEGSDVCYKGNDGLHRLDVKKITPEEIAELAEELKSKGNIGVAFTYNEPLVSYEFVIDTAKLVHKRGMKTLLVSNGCVNDEIACEVLPFIDAANIDLKCFTKEGYRSFLKGDIELTENFITKAAGHIHLELTTLIVPGFNDSENDMKKEACWIADLCGGRGADIPLHISRFFPRHKLTDRQATDPETVYRLADIAGQYLKFVYMGNMGV